MSRTLASQMLFRLPSISGRARSLRHPAAVTLAAVSPLLTAAWIGSVQAQEPSTRQALRALNLARNYVVRLNGGLGVYRPAQCMFQTPAPENPCLVRRDEQGYRFHFLGGPPAWQQQNLMPTRETEILVSPEGRAVERLVFDGEPRPAARAISLARTEAVRLNGGPQAYEPAACMEAPSAVSGNPCLVSQDEQGYRFRFPGGSPDWQMEDREPTTETEILISPGGTAVDRVIHNGPPR